MELCTLYWDDVMFYCDKHYLADIRSRVWTILQAYTFFTSLWCAGLSLLPPLHLICGNVILQSPVDVITQPYLLRVITRRSSRRSWPLLLDQETARLASTCVRITVYTLAFVFYYMAGVVVVPGVRCRWRYKNCAKFQLFRGWSLLISCIFSHSNARRFTSLSSTGHM